MANQAKTILHKASRDKDKVKVSKDVTREWDNRADKVHKVVEIKTHRLVPRIKTRDKDKDKAVAASKARAVWKMTATAVAAQAANPVARVAQATWDQDKEEMTYNVLIDLPANLYVPYRGVKICTF